MSHTDVCSTPGLKSQHIPFLQAFIYLAMLVCLLRSNLASHCNCFVFNCDNSRSDLDHFTFF